MDDADKQLVQSIKPLLCQVYGTFSESSIEKVSYTVYLTDPSNFIKMCKSAGDLLETTRSGKYTLSEQTKKKAEEAIDETNKAMAKMLRVKKVDIDKLNSPWRNIAEGIRTDKIDYVVQKAEVSAIREEAKNIFETLNSLSSAIKDFKETENGGQILGNIFEYSPLVLDSVSTATQTFAAFNKIELPCKWEWLKKASAERKTAGGRTLPSNIIVVLTGLEVGAVALDTAAEYVRVADTYSKIEANYAEYQKYLDLLRSIGQDEFFPDYVRNGAGEIAGMFSNGGDPNWDEFDKRVQAAQRKEIALGAFEAIIDIANIFFPVVYQVKFVYDGIGVAGDFLGVAALAETMVDAEIYYSITRWSATLFSRGTKMVMGYFESIEDASRSGEAGKYAVQLAQSRIIGLNAVKELLLKAQFVEWVNRLIQQAFNNRSEADIRNEYEKAIKSVYEIAKKCGMRLSDHLPMYYDFNTK